MFGFLWGYGPFVWPIYAYGNDEDYTFELYQVNERIDNLENDKLKMFTFKGEVDTQAQLPLDANEGDVYLVSDTRILFGYYDNHWVNMGDISKLTGADGKSAYDLAVAAGFNGDVNAWLASLKGANGADGKDGKSAYEVATANGYVGTITDWLTSLKGPAGESFLETVHAAYPNLITTDDVLNYLKGAKGDTGATGASALEVAEQNDPSIKDYQTWKASIKGEKGDTGQSAFEQAQANGFTGTFNDWIATFKGDQGKQGNNGTNGTNGKSAYELAVDNGYVGSLASWIASLKGNDGTNGTNGTNGKDGKSAYEIALESGFTGTSDQWIASLKGADGKSAYEVAVANGYTGTISQWLASLQGASGKSAYDVAVANGFTGTATDWLASLSGASAYDLAVKAGFSGTVNDWLASLKGAKGDTGNTGNTGASAYDVAVTNGFSGSVDEWLTSLKGTNGKSAYEVAVDQGYKGTVTQWLASLVGAQGLSAYDVAVQTGFTGSASDWLKSLIGADGKNGNVITGQVSAYGDLPNSKVPDGTTYLVGDDMQLYVYTDATGWKNYGSARGPVGPQGEPGAMISGNVDNTTELPNNPGNGVYYTVGDSLTLYEYVIPSGENGGAWQKIGDMRGPAGADGKGLQIDGAVATVADLPLTVVESPAYYLTTSDGHLHKFDGSTWTDYGQLRGDKGDKGDPGSRGADGDNLQLDGHTDSADALPTTLTTSPQYYTVGVSQEVYKWDGQKWTDTGTSLRGPQGIQGDKGDPGAQGDPGPQGADGNALDYGSFTYASHDHLVRIGDIKNPTNSVYTISEGKLSDNVVSQDNTNNPAVDAQPYMYFLGDHGEMNVRQPASVSKDSSGKVTSLVLVLGSNQFDPNAYMQMSPFIDIGYGTNAHTDFAVRDADIAPKCGLVYPTSSAGQKPTYSLIPGGYPGLPVSLDPATQPYVKLEIKTNMDESNYHDLIAKLKTYVFAAKNFQLIATIVSWYRYQDPSGYYTPYVNNYVIWLPQIDVAALVDGNKQPIFTTDELTQIASLISAKALMVNVKAHVIVKHCYRLPSDTKDAMTSSWHQKIYPATYEYNYFLQ